MASDPRYRSSGDRGPQAWPRWMIVVVPLLVVVVVAGLWWALIAPEPSGRKEPTPTPWRRGLWRLMLRPRRPRALVVRP